MQSQPRISPLLKADGGGCPEKGLRGVAGERWKECEMFLKKVTGPRQVTLPDGSVLTRADLPGVDTRRWVASRKAVVVQAVIHGLLPLGEALERYDLSEEEFTLWRAAVEKHGAKGLKVTAIQKIRQL